MLTSGAVCVVPDPFVRPKNKPKWHICVCPLKKQFLRINSKPIWKPWHMLEEANNVFLAHDSYVELAQLHFLADTREAQVIGSLTPTEARALATTAQHVPTLTQEQKDIVWERLGSL